jgi:flagellar basal-body rod protein FlgF
MSEITDQVSVSIDALMQEFEIITHNLANVSTVGYKRFSNSFSQALQSQDGSMADSFESTPIELVLDFSQGSIIETGRPLDFALYGKGFFVIETPDGPLYSRNGTFMTNENGQIVDTEGRTVAGQAGPITIPTNIGLSQVSVSSDGSISAGGTTIGKFKLVDFEGSEETLTAVGAGCFAGPENIQPTDAENLVVKQGYQETSNVKLIDELVDMIMVTRLYEANMKSLSAQSEASDSLMDVAMG